MKARDEEGAVTVEAAIYFPIVFLVVMFLVCVGIAKLQGTLLYYYVEKISSEAAKTITYTGYENLLGDDDSLAADMKKLPSEQQVSDYYAAKANDLYHFKISYTKENTVYSKKLKEMVQNLYLIAGGLIKPEVTIKGGLIPKAEVKIIYEITLPSAFDYITRRKGTFGKTPITAYSRSMALNQTEFVRNMDIVADILEFLADKLGISDNISSAMEKMKKYKDKFL